MRYLSACCSCFLFFLQPPPISPLFPYTTLFRSRPRSQHLAPDRLALPLRPPGGRSGRLAGRRPPRLSRQEPALPPRPAPPRDRKSTRLNSSHRCISYAVFCLKKKKPQKTNRSVH